jgi:hypothetical protein
MTPKRFLLTTALIALLAGGVLASHPSRTLGKSRWRSLPAVTPVGHREDTGAYVIGSPSDGAAWKKPAFVYNAKAATGRKLSRVVVLIYDPKLESQGGKSLIEYVRGNDPVEYSHILANVIREASWGYINYEIVDVLRIDAFPVKADGFRYTDETYLAARKTQQWQPSTSSYRKMLEENGLLERCRRGEVNEVWIWGASGMHMDELAMSIPNRYARFAPTENPWFYRPYDIPDVGHTLWMMGFNYEVGPDNMIHSYTHRVESMAALALADGVWDTKTRRDPWNLFSWLEMDHPGTPSQVGNCHVPPNGQGGYDYNNSRRVLSNADAWARYPNVTGKPRLISSQEWGNSQFGYQKWILEHVPKYPGATRYGYNNWWVYVANTDEELPDLPSPGATSFTLPEGLPVP